MTTLPRPPRNPLTPCALALLLAAGNAAAFDSGSTGADGAFAPTVNTTLDLPEDGIFNFTTVHIPSGIVVKFRKNTTNTPVVMLASGDVTIDGEINLNGDWSTPVGTAGNGNISDDGLPGEGGPGGYDGGVGGSTIGDRIGGDGHGPSGGGRGLPNGKYRSHGGPGGYATRGASRYSDFHGSFGTAYGSSLILPLIGGSGGGGGMGGNTFAGSGGAGGGGAILIASSGKVQIKGRVHARGGRGGDSAGSGCGAIGGPGSGGAIRIVADTIAGAGELNAEPSYRFNIKCRQDDGYRVIHARDYVPDGGWGRIRLEADVNQYTATTKPVYTFGPPGDLFIAGLPTLRISKVAGVSAPTNPSGVADINLPADIANPVTVEFEATGIPLGPTVKLTATPQRGGSATAVSTALDGDANLATATAQINLPQGPSTLLAHISYTLIASVAESFEHYADGEKVREMRIEASLDGEPRYVLITESGREIPLSKAQLAAAG